MKNYINKLDNFFNDDEDGTAISEYALVIGLIFVITASYVTSFGVGINSVISKATNQLPV